MTSVPLNRPYALVLVDHSGARLRWRDADRRAGRQAARRALRALRLAGGERLVVSHGRGRAPRALLRQGRGPGVPVPVSLSLSHRDGRAVAVAAGAGVRVGVDLERVGGVPPGTERYFLTNGERASGVDRTLLWTLKEAAWKALGCGGETSFTALELRLDAAGRLRALALHGRSVPADAWVSTPWPGYRLAVVWLAEVAA